MNIIIYCVVLIVLAGIDSIWLFSMGSHYKGWLADIFAPQFTFLPAIIFYIIYAAGLLYFVIYPALKNHAPLHSAFLAGAFLGFLAYAAYDLTNQATLKEWPMIVTIVDMAWGTFLSGITSLIVFLIFR